MKTNIQDLENALKEARKATRAENRRKTSKTRADSKRTVTLRLSPEAIEKLRKQPNQSAFVEKKIVEEDAISRLIDRLSEYAWWSAEDASELFFKAIQHKSVVEDIAMQIKLLKKEASEKKYNKWIKEWMERWG